MTKVLTGNFITGLFYGMCAMIFFLGEIIIKTPMLSQVLGVLVAVSALRRIIVTKPPVWVALGFVAGALGFWALF